MCRIRSHVRRHRWTLPEVFLVVVVAAYTRPYPSRASPQPDAARRSQDVAVQSAERVPRHTRVAERWPDRGASRLDYSPHPARPRPRPFSWRTYRATASRGRSTPSSSGSMTNSRCQGGYTHRTESRRHALVYTRNVRSTTRRGGESTLYASPGRTLGVALPICVATG